MAEQRSGKNRRATIRDVAVHAQVSISTVSHVINNTASISEETRRKIQAAIEELDYSPNAMARELRQKHSNLIGVMVPDIANEFYAQCASGLLQETDPDQNIAMVCDTGYNLQRERRQVEALIERRVSGLVFFGGFNTDAARLAHRAGVRVVLGDWGPEGFTTVEFDNATPFRQLIQRLTDRGVRKIGYISEPVELFSVVKRYEAFRQGMEAGGLAVEPRWVLIDRRLQMDKLKNAGELMREYLDRTAPGDLPEVFIASNDLVACSVIEALNERGISVPGDIGVAGVDDIPFARRFNPPLTTVRQNAYQLGSVCFDLLQRQADHKLGDQHIRLDCELIIRQSVRL